MKEELKILAIEKIKNAAGGFILLTFDEKGFVEMDEMVEDNAVAEKAAKLSDLVSEARIKYMNWRTKEGK